ncbi:hypothetical protein GCM10010913_16980 [Paenibacillus aceti]|uniref:Uncharacterized protein n=1 Tax=Paenibacillus aceti TaxID=1820010 RepID=A0ABQ1VTP7_9BACL|nr:hypothetical protein GCM10010913_16980 [Paenibacillus aceti]
MMGHEKCRITSKFCVNNGDKNAPLVGLNAKKILDMIIFIDTNQACTL